MHEDPEDHNRLLLSFFSKGVGMFAAIDLGSNSFRLHIGEYVNGIVSRRDWTETMFCPERRWTGDWMR